MMVVVLLLSHVRLFATLWTAACWAPLSVRLPRQEYWSGLPLPSPGEVSPRRDQTHISCIVGPILYRCATREAQQDKGRKGRAF